MHWDCAAQPYSDTLMGRGISNQAMEGIRKDRYSRAKSVLRAAEVTPYFEDFHILSVSEDMDYPLHQHQNYEAILVRRGPYRCRLNGEMLELKRHEVLVIKPGDWHQDLLRAGQYHYVLHFQIRQVPEGAGREITLFQEAVRPPDQVCRGLFPEEAGLFKALADETRREESYAAEVQDHYLGVLFWRFVRRIDEASLSSQFRRLSENRDFAARLEHLFERHKEGALGVDGMAAELGLSRRALSMRCAELFGASPARLFAAFKVRKAEEWLAHTGEPVKVIAYRLGFANPYHFSRVFKRHAGKPPSAFRQK